MDFKITKKLRGDDQHKLISIRIPQQVFNGLERLSAQTNLSRNAIITKMLQYGLDHCVIVEDEPY